MEAWEPLGAAVTALLLAFSADLLLGDPRWMPHPVKLIGKAVSATEKLLRSIFKGDLGERAAGVVIVLIVGGGSFFVTFFVLKFSFTLNFYVGLILYIFILYTLLAVKDMRDHIKNVLFALEENNLELARHRVSSLVSRDTCSLSEEGVTRAAMESLFENASDGVAAPLFYAAMGGPPLAVFYKAVNTLDSMIGYKDKGYYYLGWAAAKADDILNFIPARLTALLFIITGVIVGWGGKRGWGVLLQDRSKHSSPNSAWPEAAGAGVLNVRLGGADLHSGVKVVKPVINRGANPPVAKDLKKGLALFYFTSVLSLGFALLLTYIVFILLAFPWKFFVP